MRMRRSVRTGSFDRCDQWVAVAGGASQAIVTRQLSGRMIESEGECTVSVLAGTQPERMGEFLAKNQLGAVTSGLNARICTVMAPCPMRELDTKGLEVRLHAQRAPTLDVLQAALLRGGARCSISSSMRDAPPLQ